MDKFTVKKWAIKFSENLSDGICAVWEWLGIYKKVMGLIMSAIVAWFTNKVLSLTTFWRGFVYTLVAYLAIAIFYALFIRPYKVFSKQEHTISLLNGKVNVESIIGTLVRLREEGTVLRNKGNNILHESQINTWWDDHLDWRRTTMVNIELLDNNKAIQWNTLDTFTPKRDFPKAFNPDVRHKLRMFEEWLDRLDRLIDDFSS